MKARRTLVGVFCAGIVALGIGSAPARAAFDDPFLTFTPPLSSNDPKPPPLGMFYGPCGLTVDSGGKFYVANYYLHNVDIFNTPAHFPTPNEPEPVPRYVDQIFHVDPLDGPCGLAVDNAGNVYVNNFHRNVEKFTPSVFPVTKSTEYTSAGIFNSAHPTGVAIDPSTGNVYVDARTHVAAYDSTGAPLLDGGGEPLKIGLGSLEDGYGLARSEFSTTAGRLYVPDAEDDTVKVYDPAVDIDDPVQTITGPPGGFVSLHDSAVAVDRVTGEIYVADTLGPQFSEHSEATIYVFDSTGAHKGRLKYNVVDGVPPGLAVDNSTFIHPETELPTQGRVYVTTGNTVSASVYGYPPGAATSAGAPAIFSLSLSATGSGDGSVSSELGNLECSTACEAEVPGGARITLTAAPDEGSAFAGWSGGECSGTGSCTLEMSQARSVSAEFDALSTRPDAPVSRRPDSGGAFAGASDSEITQKGTLRVAVSGELAPRRLPRSGTAPISVSVGGKIRTTDQSLPPQLKALRIELNRNGRLDYVGLPTCDYSRIQPASTSRAMAACRSSLVGRGSFTANITLAGQEPYPTEGRLLVFNGVRNGKPVLFGHIFSAYPFSASFVIVFAVRNVAKGTYGAVLDAPLPKAMDAWGRLTGLEMTLSRRYSHRGRRHSYISAGCPAPKGFRRAFFPLARTSFFFKGGIELKSVLTSTCQATG